MSAAINLDMLRAASSAEFPVIDLGAYMRDDEGALHGVAAQLREALENIGFLIVVNHGVSPTLSDAGDMLKRWTNDRFLSTQHLAINLTDRQRYSTPFFYTPHIDHPIVCLPTCTSADDPPRYPPITYGEYRVWWLNTNYGAKLNPGNSQLHRA